MLKGIADTSPKENEKQPDIHNTTSHISNNYKPYYKSTYEKKKQQNYYNTKINNYNKEKYSSKNLHSYKNHPTNYYNNKILNYNNSHITQNSNHNYYNPYFKQYKINSSFYHNEPYNKNYGVNYKNRKHSHIRHRDLEEVDLDYTKFNFYHKYPGCEKFDSVLIDKLNEINSKNVSNNNENINFFEFLKQDYNEENEENNIGNLNELLKNLDEYLEKKTAENNNKNIIFNNSNNNSNSNLIMPVQIPLNYKVSLLNNIQNQKINEFLFLQKMKLIQNEQNTTEINPQTQSINTFNNLIQQYLLNIRIQQSLVNKINTLFANNSNIMISNQIQKSNIDKNNNLIINNNENLNNKKKVSSTKYIQNILSSYSPTETYIKPYQTLLSPKMQNSIKINTNNYLLSQNQFSNNNTKQKDNENFEENLRSGKLLVGIIHIKQSQMHGYVSIHGLDNDILITGQKNLNKCLNLDEVLVELLPTNQWKTNKKIFTLISDVKTDFETKEERIKYINEKFPHLRPCGTIIKVLNSPNMQKPHVCKLIIENNILFAESLESSLPIILITKKMEKIEKLYDIDEVMKTFPNFIKKYFLVQIYAKSFKFNDQINKCNNKYHGPVGYILKELGESGDPSVETEAILREYGINYNEIFSGQVMNELNKKIKQNVINDDYIKANNRKDFTKEFTFSITESQCKDINNVINVKIIDIDKKLFEVGIHTTDPTLFIEENSILDKEALNRSSDLYLINKKLPMLPIILSEYISSILPNKDTLTISLMFRINLIDGKLDENFKPYFCLSIVNNKINCNYSFVNEIINGNFDEININLNVKKLIEAIKILNEISNYLKIKRNEKGALIIKNNENENYGKKIIDELMLFSNKLCAEFLYKNNKEDCLLKRLPLILTDEMRNFLLNDITYINIDHPQKLNKLLSTIKNSNQNKYICILHKLKYIFLQQEEYVTGDQCPFIALKYYIHNFDLFTHYTSPLRNYTDIAVIRQLKQILNKKVKSNDEIKRYIDYFNQKALNFKMIKENIEKLKHYLYIKNDAQKDKLYNAIIMDSVHRMFQKNSAVDINSEIVDLILFIPEIDLEIVWKKENNREILLYQYNQMKNEIYIDYLVDGNGPKSMYLKLFDSIKVKLIYVDSIPIDIKCIIDL